MKKIIFSMALSIAMISTVMAHEAKPVVKVSANTTTTFEIRERTSKDQNSGRPYIDGARFNVYFDFGFGVGGYQRKVYTTSGNVFDTDATLLGLQVFNPTLGVRIFDYGFIGIQLGYTDIEMLFSKVRQGYSTTRVNMFTQSFPLMIDFRGFFPINQDVHPFVEFAFGRSPEFIFCESYNGDEAWMYEYNDWFNKTRLGVGIDIRRLSLGLGWNRNWGYDEYNGTTFSRDYFYMKIGVKVGKRE